VCKYRKKLLFENIKDDIKEIFNNISSNSSNSDFSIDLMESDQDHIHLLISYIPRLSVCSIVNRLKSKSTTVLWQKHDSFLKKHFWNEKTFWSDGYFVCSIGEASTSTIKNYILNQG
jgi:putative transposase